MLLATGVCDQMGVPSQSFTQAGLSAPGKEPHWRYTAVSMACSQGRKWNFSSKITFNLAYLSWLTSAISSSYWLFQSRTKTNIALAEVEGHYVYIQKLPFTAAIYQSLELLIKKKRRKFLGGGVKARLKSVQYEAFWRQIWRNLAH